MLSIDPEYPVFALAFCIMRKEDYMSCIVPRMQALKFRTWGHDAVILHEHDIRKSKGDFALLRTDADLRGAFFRDLNDLIASAPIGIIASVIDKVRHREKYVDPWNPYEIALRFCMENLLDRLSESEEAGRTVHVIFESRGIKEDNALKREFNRITSNEGQWGHRRPDFTRFTFRSVFVPKTANSSGLQLADLIARPVALSYLRPDQPNRAWNILEPKLLARKCFP